jgi:hypothetical protein
MPGRHQVVAVAGNNGILFPLNPTLAVLNQIGRQGPAAPFEIGSGSCDFPISVEEGSVGRVNGQ